jgi:queuine tRNA-ribosyltransferase
MQTLVLPHGALSLPIFLPDATYGTVRAADAADLRGAGVRGLVMNTFHLMQKPGSSTIDALGGLHKMAGWDGPIVTDSGGFQAYSLIRQNPRFGRLSDNGITFQPEGAIRKFQLTPEKCVQLQLAYGADIVICLDDCTHVDDPDEEQRTSVQRTIRLARRCRDEFDRQVKQRRLPAERQPRLFAVVQGGADHALRRECAEALLEIGFDGYGFGGWPLDAEGQLIGETLDYTRALIPRQFPMHALGVGQPGNVVACAAMGYEIFDSALPTRDARNGRVYAFNSDPADADAGLRGEWYSYVYIADKKHIKTARPLSEWCDCYTCATYSLGYLHHLHKISETLYLRLATIHNVRFLTRLMEILRSAGS